MGGVSYTAIGIVPGGQTSSCSTNTTTCNLTQLVCGQIYSITVTASNGQCSSNQSATLQVTSGTAHIIIHKSSIFVLNIQNKCLVSLFLSNCPSVPCPPARVNSSITCQTNAAQVQWDRNGGAESYEVSALGTQGYVTQCNTTGTFCNMSSLLCGDVYNISVVALSNMCRVRGNPVPQLNSGKIAHIHIHILVTLLMTITFFFVKQQDYF